MTLKKNTATGVEQATVFQRFANFEHHFVGVNKMVPAGHSEWCLGINAGVCERRARVVESNVELLEA